MFNQETAFYPVPADPTSVQRASVDLDLLPQSAPCDYLATSTTVSVPATCRSVRFVSNGAPSVFFASSADDSQAEIIATLTAAGYTAEAE